jgi:long-chain acyl-CoA synthetase
LFIRGRKKSLINVAGMKVFPEEVEAVLATHPAVARCRVSAIDHPHFGQIPTAEVIPAHSPPPSPRALIDFCRLHLAPHKIPARIAFVDALPLTPSGKLRRG